MEEKTKLTLIYYSVLGVGLIMSGLLAMIVPGLEVKAMSAFLGILGLLGVKFFANDLPTAILEHRILKKELSTEKPTVECLPNNATTSTIIKASPGLKEAATDFFKALTPEKEDEEPEEAFPLSSQ